MAFPFVVAFYVAIPMTSFWSCGQSAKLTFWSHTWSVGDEGCFLLYIVCLHSRHYILYLMSHFRWVDAQLMRLKLMMVLCNCWIRVWERVVDHPVETLALMRVIKLINGEIINEYQGWWKHEERDIRRGSDPCLHALSKALISHG
jgi:hypothetical protein